MNEPDPPSLRRTLERRMWSSHSCVGWKLYLAANCFKGGLSKVHIPSWTGITDPAASNRAAGRMREVRILRENILGPHKLAELAGVAELAVLVLLAQIGRASGWETV